MNDDSTAPIDLLSGIRATCRDARRWYPLAALAAGLLLTCIAFWLQFSRASVAEELLDKIGQKDP